jgi:hypothetical protein
MSPPVDANENALPAKESGLEKLTRRLTSFNSKLHSRVCKRFLSFELTSASSQLLHPASNQNYLARHFGMSQFLSNLARQIGESQSSLARQIGESQCVASETLRRVSYLLRSAETSARAKPACWQSQVERGPKKQKNKKVNFGKNDTPSFNKCARGPVRWWLRPLPRGGAAQGPSLGESGERAGVR